MCKQANTTSKQHCTPVFSHVVDCTIVLWKQISGDLNETMDKTWHSMISLLWRIKNGTNKSPISSQKHIKPEKNHWIAFVKKSLWINGYWHYNKAIVDPQTKNQEMQARTEARHTYYISTSETDTHYIISKTTDWWIGLPLNNYPDG